MSFIRRFMTSQSLRESVQNYVKETPTAIAELSATTGSFAIALVFAEREINLIRDTFKNGSTMDKMMLGTGIAVAVPVVAAGRVLVLPIFGLIVIKKLVS